MPSPSASAARPHYPFSSSREPSPGIVLHDPENTQNTSLPSFWTSGSYYSTDSLPPAHRKGIFEGIFEGWRHVILGSYLNILLVFVPISWGLSFTFADSHGLRFTFCILALIPLVKLHDVSTHELALRIGGSKTGLINASLSNTVAVVVAITALRKCELSVVQSSLIGSMLSKLLLVLGLCFFAGGMRFSEQVWNPTATQVHSSLLSISVGALLLPVAYHFALSGAMTPIPEVQVNNILKMSHGVSVVLLFIYAAYLLFQLWSHSHLYDDSHNKTSKKFSFRRLHTSQTPPDNSIPSPLSAKNLALLSPPHKLYSQRVSTDASASQLTLTTLNGDNHSELNLDEPTIRLVSGPGGRSVSVTTRVGSEDAPTSDKVEGHCVMAAPDPQVVDVTEHPAAPRVSWVLAALVLVVVTVAASITADELVESMDGISHIVSKDWCALILLPAVTSIAECMTAVNVSVKDRLAFSISVALGSTVQTALFVIPFIVILGWMMGKPLPLLMDPFQSLVLYTSVQTVGYVVADGKSNWLEGLILICLYIVIAVSFWYYTGVETSLGICVAA